MTGELVRFPVKIHKIINEFIDEKFALQTRNLISLNKLKKL